MKSFRNFTGMAAFAVFAFFLGTSAQAASPGAVQAKAVVKNIEGSNARYRDAATGAQLELTKGLELVAGSVVATGPGTTVTLDLGDNGNTVVIRPSSTMAINSLTMSGDNINTELDVRQGSILGNVKKLTAASDYKVKTARGTAGIRGTTYVAYAIGIYQCTDGSLLITLFAVDPATGNQVQFVLEAGQSANCSEGTPNPVIREMTAAEQQAINNEAGATLIFRLRIPDTSIIEQDGEFFISPTKGAESSDSSDSSGNSDS